VTPHAISALARTGVKEVLFEAHRLAQMVTLADQTEDQLPVYRPEPDGSAFKIERDPDGSWRVTGQGVERAAAMTYWEYEEAVRRFQQLLVRIGVNEGLQEAGIRAGDTVHIGEYEMEWKE